MKLSLALGIVLASAPAANAFAPSAIIHRAAPSSFQHEFITPITNNNNNDRTCLSMVGGGMIERPPGDDSSSDDTPGDSSSDAAPTSSSSSAADPYAVYAEEKEKFLAKLGRDIEIDPWDPNPYIKPRPGKYGWTDNTKQVIAQQEEAAKVVNDEELAVVGQRMDDTEREENLNVVRRLRLNDVPMLRRSGDLLASAEAAADANAREKADPWFDLNERLGDAIKYDTEDVDKLKALMTKVGGPPPQLVKYADHPRGYVLRTEVIGMNVSNNRLEKMIDRMASLEDDGREEVRKEAVRKQMSKLDNPVKEESDLAEIQEIARQREEEYLRGIMDQEARTSQYRELMKEEEKEYKTKREELLKQLEGAGEGGEEVEYVGAQAEFVDKTMKDFVTDLKRMNNMFEEDEDDESVGLLGEEVVEEASAADAGAPMSKAAQARAEAMKNDGSGRPRLPGDADVTKGELAADAEVNESSSSKTGPLTVEVSSAYNTENSDPPMRKHCFQYTVRITNDSESDTVQLLSRRFEIQTVGSSMKDVVQGEGVTGRQPVLKPGEVFEYTSTAPLSVRPIGTTEIAARMSGEYRYCVLEEGQEKATDEQVNAGQGEAGAELGTFHFVFPEEQRVKPVRPSDEDDDDDEEEEAVKTTTVASTTAAPATAPPAAKDATTTSASSSSTPASSLPGEPDMTSGNISTPTNDSSDTLTSDVRVVVTSTYRPERSDAKLDKHCFAYNVRITNESKSDQSIQLVSRRFEIQTVGSANKDVVQGPGVTGRQPVLKPGESFEYTSTAPLSVRPMLDKTKVVARMSGEYNFVQLAEDGKTPLSSTPLKAELGGFHFILPE
jgi:ApaG protein